MRLRGFIIAIIILSMMSTLAIVDMPSVLGTRVIQDELMHPAAELGVPTDFGCYIIIELPEALLPSQGVSLSSLLTEHGIVHVLYTVNEVIANPALLDDAQALIIDSSCGSADGSAVSEEFITLLVRMDLPTILVGRAAWLVHRLRQTSPPSTTASIESYLHTTPEFNGAVFFSQPTSLTMGSLLTAETGLTLPVDEIQAERSRLIDLTGTTTPAVLSPLRYESWPLDVFLIGPEDPTLWTVNGKGLFVNTVAYATALRETSLATLFESVQSKEGQTLAGGLHHSHSPSIEGTYLAVHAIHDISTFEVFSAWQLENQELVQLILGDLYEDFGSEAGFADSLYDSTVSVDTTAMGLWLVTVMGLGSQFSITKLTSYIGSRQSVDGGFSNHMTVSYHATEALYESGGLDEINTATLESWLRSCIVDGDTGTPENWGGIAKNPTIGESHNIYSSQYVLSLWMLGKAHTDPAKLTEWTLETRNGDGSFRDTIGADLHITRGTASALTTMSVLGTLDSSNMTAGLAWFVANQLPSGGFGMGLATDDIVGKTWAVAEVAVCLNELGLIFNPVTTGIRSYIDAIQSEAGFELMDEIPSLMWSYWLSDANRLAHTGKVDNGLIGDYLHGFEGTALIQYPGHSNLSVVMAPEYDNQQYYLSGVWPQFFGVGLAASSATTLSPSQVSSITFYLSMRQASTGHYKPSVIGLPHMQYTVAAVEALYHLDELDTIWYRSALEAEVLSLYSSGSWSSSGWNLAPFVGVQSAIDFLSTRTALRLELVTPIMAAEIASTIESRLQYNDLWALSWDVKTLALLNTSAFSIGLDSIDSDSILNNLGSTFAEGWFNSSTPWQPVFTAGVLEMLSIIGLRPRMNIIEGCSLSVSIPSSVQLGETLDIGVSIASSQPSHSIFVHAFDSWTLFENVLEVDTLSLIVPSNIDAIGVQDVSLVVWNWGMSRAFGSDTTDVLGSMEGTLSVQTPYVVSGDTILGTVSWNLSGGGDAGATDVTIRLSNGSYFRDLTSAEFSPYDFLISTDGLGAGPYNLIVTLRRDGCNDLVLWKTVSVRNPVYTYITSISLILGGVGNETLIPFSLNLESNGSTIAGETVALTIWDESLNVVHTDMLVSSDGSNDFSWTPSTRGLYTFNLHFARNDVLMESEFNGAIEIYEQPSIMIELDEDLIAPGSATLRIVVLDSDLEGLPGVAVHAIVTLNGSPILDSIGNTQGDGSLTFLLGLAKPGALEVIIDVPPEGWLLEVSTDATYTVFGETTLLLSLPGQPIKQGTTLGISVLVLDWTSSPLIGADVQVKISWYNGTVIRMVASHTGVDGTCLVSHTFNFVGDFRIDAAYAGSGLNSSSNNSVVQRVYVIPSMILIHDPTVNVGNTIEFFVGIKDALEHYIAGRTLSFSITINGMTVFQTQVTSVNGLAAILWSPSERGLAMITLIHNGGTYYQANFTDSSLSVMELVNGTIELSSSTVDLFNSVILTYNLVSTGDIEGIDIVFQVLGMDLVPVWTEHAVTDASGIAHAVYYVDDLHGLLKATAAPTDDQFMLGGNRQSDLTVKTYAHTATDLLPKPPSVGQLIDVTIMVRDDLGIPIDGLRITVKIYNIFDELILTRTRDTIDGLTVVQFTPTQWGLYSVEVSSTGGPSVHSFFEDRNDHEHTVYCPTSLTLSIEDIDIEVGNSLRVVARLLNIYGNPLVGMNVNLVIEGDTTLGPVTRITNSSGYVSWEVIIDEQGFWIVHAEFYGLATYLPMSDSMAVHSSFGTSVILELLNQGNIVAGLIPLNASVLLLDSAGSPLEGRTIQWAAYHLVHGLLCSGSIIQQGVEPEVVEILLIRGGNYTIVFSFAGSAHYHSSNSAMDILVMGTSTIIIDGPSVIDRASSKNITISVVDELGFSLNPEALPVVVTLTNVSGVVEISLWLNSDSLILDVFGLCVGDYSLNITIAESNTRIGAVVFWELKIVTQSELVTMFADLSGIVGQKHTLSLSLVGSLNETMRGMTIWVSLYRPDGVEVYGSIGDMTPINLQDGLGEVSWTPSWTGNYTLIIQYFGDEWRLPTLLSIDILTRRFTTFTVKPLYPVDYPMNVEIEATLSSALSKLGGAQVSFAVFLGEDIVTERTVSTNSRGVAITSFDGLLAGAYMIRVYYAGTDSLAPCMLDLELEVRPTTSTNLLPLTEPYVTSNCSLKLSVTVLGVDVDWSGTFVLSVYDPQNTLLLNHTLPLQPHFELVLYIVLGIEGQYRIDITILGLPVVESIESELLFLSTSVPLSIALDAGSTPVVAGAPIIALLGLALRKRLGASIEGLPTEWSG
ncbi:MAG: hypothetical protein ACFFDQ_06760 [Candidatus Thorarchaeota archaeon]